MHLPHHAPCAVLHITPYVLYDSVCRAQKLGYGLAQLSIAVSQSGLQIAALLSPRAWLLRFPAIDVL